MTVDTPTTTAIGGALTVPDWMVDEVLAALPDLSPDEQLWWWRPGLLEYPVRSREWLRRQIRRIPDRSFGAARHGTTGAFAQIVKVGGGSYAVEVGWAAEWPSQVRGDDLPDGDSVTALPDVVRGVGSPAAVRTGRCWRHGANAAAEIAWTWASESRLPGGFSARPAL
ncbi:MAG TPA: hypothetical protein VGC37_18720 [Friedmanniella sp.]